MLHDALQDSHPPISIGTCVSRELVKIRQATTTMSYMCPYSLYPSSFYQLCPFSYFFKFKFTKTCQIYLSPSLSFHLLYFIGFHPNSRTCPIPLMFNQTAEVLKNLPLEILSIWFPYLVIPVNCSNAVKMLNQIHMHHFRKLVVSERNKSKDLNQRQRQKTMMMNLLFNKAPPP